MYNFKGLTRSIFDLDRAVNALRSKNLLEDIKEAQKNTLNYYVKRVMKHRFMGQLYNPDYPKLSPKYLKWKQKTVGFRPKMVLYGNLKNTTLNSRAYRFGNRVSLKLRTTYYSKYLLQKGFNYIPPKLSSEEKQLSKYFNRNLGKIRRARSGKIA